QNIIGVVLFTPLFFLINDTASIQMQLIHLYNIKTAIYVLILAIFCSSVAFIFYLKGIRYFGIGKANVFTNLIPVVTAVLSFFLVGESFPIYKVIGILIVICGIFLVQKKTTK
ncbi:MAG: DMT family transporter, partial [Bacteroidales bacterium]